MLTFLRGKQMKLIVEIRGGVLTQVYIDAIPEDEEVLVDVLDWDDHAVGNDKERAEFNKLKLRSKKMFSLI